MAYLANLLLDGRVAVLLGMGASEAAMRLDRNGLRSPGAELTEILASQLSDRADGSHHYDLARAASLIASIFSQHELQQLIDGYSDSFSIPTALHVALAAAAQRKPLVIVVNSFDRLTERAMDEQGCAYQVVIPGGRDNSREPWMIQAQGVDVMQPTMFPDLETRGVTTIVKAREYFDGFSQSPQRRFLVTEEHLFDTLSSNRWGMLAGQLNRRGLLCLGFDLFEWWDRWLLMTIRRNQMARPSAVQGWYFSRDADAVTLGSLRSLQLNSYSVDLDEFAAALQQAVITSTDPSHP